MSCRAANLFISGPRCVKLGDFGIAKATRTGLAKTQIGTPFYMSPEVWRNVPYDEKSDMWALGVVLYEMAALRHPFEARSERCLSHKVIQGDLDPLPSGFSADITSMVRLLLDKVWPPRLSPAAALPSPPPLSY